MAVEGVVVVRLSHLLWKRADALAQPARFAAIGDSEIGAALQAAPIHR
jgi:hypothetical protein